MNLNIYQISLLLVVFTVVTFLYCTMRLLWEYKIKLKLLYYAVRLLYKHRFKFKFRK